MKIPAQPDSLSATSNVQAKAVRAVAYVEAFKGVVVLLTASGLLALIHHNLHAVAAAFIAHMHLNPASKYPQIFLDAASRLDDSRLLLLAGGAMAYALLRFVEAYGLFFERTWAELLAALSGAIYVPFEVVELVRDATWHGATLLGINLAIVGIMVNALIKHRAQRTGNSV